MALTVFVYVYSLKLKRRGRLVGAPIAKGAEIMQKE
jgi:hypothetical protein